MMCDLVPLQPSFLAFPFSYEESGLRQRLKEREEQREVGRALKQRKRRKANHDKTNLPGRTKKNKTAKVKNTKKMTFSKDGKNMIGKSKEREERSL